MILIPITGKSVLPGFIKVTVAVSAVVPVVWLPKDAFEGENPIPAPAREIEWEPAAVLSVITKFPVTAPGSNWGRKKSTMAQDVPAANLAGLDGQVLRSVLTCQFGTGLPAGGGTVT